MMRACSHFVRLPTVGNRYANKAMASWENWAPSWSNARHENVVWPEDPEPPDYSDITAPEAGEELFLTLVEFKLRGLLSARQTCVLAFWASRAGAVGPASEIALRPEKSSGEYSRHFDKVVAGSTNSDAELYKVPLARRARSDASRLMGEIPMVLPHEALMEELLEDSCAEDAVKAALAERELPPAYMFHPVVQAAPPGAVVHPLSIYLDGVAYSRTDSLLAVWVYHMLTERRHLVCAIRRSEMCACGCRGWDTLYPVLSVLAWSLKAMAAGTHPAQRHDGTGWRPEDQGRASFAGESLGWQAIPLLVKGDWAEYAHSLGFPTCTDSKAPCPLCCCTTVNMHSIRNYNPFGPEHAEATLGMYEQSCAAAEVKVTIPAAEMPKVRAALVYDVRKGGQRGRSLALAVPSLGLQKGDRLEPAPWAMDPSLLDDAPAPAETLWWGSSRDTRVRKRNPLFVAETYISPSSISPDWMHTLSLGVFQFFCAPLVWALLDQNAWQLECATAMLPEMGLASLREELFQWYVREARAGNMHTRVQNLTLGMLGARDHPDLRMHAAETNGFVCFCKVLLDTKGGCLGSTAKAWRRGLEPLLTMLDILRNYHTRVPPKIVQRFCDATVLHLRACSELGVAKRPKHHLMLHIGPRPAFSMVVPYTQPPDHPTDKPNRTI